MLIAFLALIALANGIFGWVARPGRLDSGVRCSSCSDSSSRRSPGCWACSWNDCAAIGSLLGERLVTNEFIAFIDLGKIKAQLDPHSFTIATYALCGFANFSSIAIQVGGIGALAPQPQIRSGPARHARGSGRHHGELHVGLHCGYAGIGDTGKSARI